MTKQHKIPATLKTALNVSYIPEQMTLFKSMIFDALLSNPTKMQCIKEEISLGKYQIQSHDIAQRFLEYTPIIHGTELA